MDATALRTALLSLLGDAAAGDGWESSLLSEALTQGLADANAWLPPVETVHRSEVGGCEQDITALAAYQILAVAYPWKDDKTFRECAVTWRMVGPTTLRLDGRRVAAGELLRIRYRKRCTVAGLGGETATTLPSSAARTVLLAAACHACLIRYRQLSRRPASAPSELQACKELADIYRRQFDAVIAAAGDPLPAWPELGL